MKSVKVSGIKVGDVVVCGDLTEIEITSVKPYKHQGYKAVKLTGWMDGTLCSFKLYPSETVQIL